MLFNSYYFLFLFLPIAIVGYWLLGRWNNRAQILWLIGANVLFYSAAGLPYLFLLLIMVIVTFFSGRYLLASGVNAKRRLGLILLLSNLLILAVFKYVNIISASLSNNPISIIFPLGISFYTFNLVSYGLDVYRKVTQAETSFIDFAAHITFFPTILSGPLTRYNEMRNQQTNPKAQWETGLFMFTIGLAKKVLIADAIATPINLLFADTSDLGLIASWVAVIGYGYQLYFDFSGYTDMATGIAYMFGYQLPQNFNAPYTARNITEFWQKWHITLSDWFRTYLFLPLSRFLLRRIPKHPDFVRTIGLLLTMTITGIWHGSTWGFIIWGAYHGLLLAIHAQSRKWKWKPLPNWLARAITFIAVSFGWVWFRSNSFDLALSLIGGMAGRHGIQINYLWRDPNPSVLLITLGILFIITNFPYDTWALHPRGNRLYAVGLAILLVVSISFLSQTTLFLYLKF
jgi:alginate O-acetyltransferase complex protein AlgI